MTALWLGIGLLLLTPLVAWWARRLIARQGHSWLTVEIIPDLTAFTEGMRQLATQLESAGRAAEKAGHALAAFADAFKSARSTQGGQ